MDRALRLFLAAAFLSLSATDGAGAQVSTNAVALAAPRPEYPYEARRAGITGSGVFILDVDSGTGRVTHVEVAQSTGSGILDRAAINALRQWRFKPGPTKVVTPMAFTTAPAATFNPNRAYPFAGTVTAVNIPAHYFTFQGVTENGVILISSATKLTRNSEPADLGQISVGDRVQGSAKVTKERVAVATSALFKSRTKR